MGYSMTMPSINQVPALEVAYFPDTDTLVLRAWGQGTGPYGESVARNLVAFTDKEGFVNGVTLERAAEMLRPYFCLDPQQVQPNEDLGSTAG